MDELRSTSAYEYDSRGNMLTKKQYDYTTGDLNGLTPSETTTFTYANSGWKDQLVAVNGTALTYDESGNLRTYGDTTYSWSHGTRLESITDGENEYGYVYDESGTRFSKTVNGETTQFYYTGGLLLAQKTGEDVIFFQYGAGGVPLGFVYNGEQYFYITNQLGDVVGIADSQGEMFVYYTYDEWGNPLETLTRYGTEEEQNIAEINPLRYRGYYYDSETGYYYLQSRYYNPEWGRFISPDSFSYIDNSTRIGFNAYVYCINSPLMYSDPSGYYHYNKEYDLSKGWKAKILKPSNAKKAHVKVYKDGIVYSQDEDGKPTDNSTGSPPSYAKEKLKEKTGWDWDAKEKSYKESQLNSNFGFSFDFSQVADVVMFAIVVAIMIVGLWFVLPFLVPFVVA